RPACWRTDAARSSRTSSPPSARWGRNDRPRRVRFAYPPMDDGPILQQFLDSAAQEPFAHLVARHVHLVYSSCLRQLKDPTLADQATQATFVLLARNAPRLTRQLSLVPFLFATAHEVCQRLIPSPGL